MTNDLEMALTNLKNLRRELLTVHNALSISPTYKSLTPSIEDYVKGYLDYAIQEVADFHHTIKRFAEDGTEGVRPVIIGSLISGQIATSVSPYQGK
jgi:hypothetical protein